MEEKKQYESPQIKLMTFSVEEWGNIMFVSSPFDSEDYDFENGIWWG